MVTSDPSPPRSGTSFASAKSGQQRRRRKPQQQQEGSNGTSTSNINNYNNDSIENGRSENQLPPKFPNSRRRFWFFRRDRTLGEFLIIFAVLYVWISLFRMEYDALTVSSSSSVSNTVGIGTNHHVAETLGVGASGSSSQDGSVVKKEGSKGKGRSTRNGSPYDSIFCKANLFGDSHGHPNTLPHTKPVFLWGIPSTKSESESGRRDLLRKTYLDFYHDLHSGEHSYPNNAVASSAANFTTSPNAICSLHDWTCDSDVRANCQMIYVFFVGGHEPYNATAEAEADHKLSTSNNSRRQNRLPPPVLLDESITDFRQMLMHPGTKAAEGLDLHEPGTVYLDIRENQFDGKMTTWFKFASLLAKEYNTATTTTATTKAASTTKTKFPNIEYVFKVDSDLMLLTPNFFKWFEGVHSEQQKRTKDTVNRLLSPARRVYGGIEFPPTNCAENFTFDHPCPLPLSGPSYMSGELNFVSVDLATYIASDNCPREKWTIPHEDVSISNYVYSYTNNTNYHKREQDYSTADATKHDDKDDDHSIHIVSVNTSRIMLLPNMRANWETLSLRKNPDALRNGELLWGHSIKRGNHTQYLYWKKDNKFELFWRFFIRVITTTGTPRGSWASKEGHPKKRGSANGKNTNTTASQSSIREAMLERMKKAKG